MDINKGAQKSLARSTKKRKRKSQRKDSYYDYEEERKNFERERQKEYSRANRLRKKEYYKKLEEQVKFLQSEVERLKAELSKTKTAKKSSDFSYNPISFEMVDSEIVMGEKLRSTETESFKGFYEKEMKEMAAKILPNSKARLNDISHCFNTTFKSLFLSPEKLLIYICNNISKVPNK